ncbi:MAG: peroxide stress protein YaaA [Gammaproteobacteria bacterium]
MLTVISPAKTLDYDASPGTARYSIPAFLDDSAVLVNELRRLEPDSIADLMNISPRLATLNATRFHEWSLPFTPDNAKQAVLVFKGDVYSGLAADSFSGQDLEFAQNKLRILSGLYGLLRPLDLMQPYRLEMGTRLKNCRGNNLYAFWGDRITEAINQELTQQGDDILVNLASNEYFKSIKLEQLNARIITPVFKDRKNDHYKVISFFAKKARGSMGRFIIRNRLQDAESIKNFTMSGYQYNDALSKGDEWAFSRERPTEA